MEYEHDPANENLYRTSFIKAFKKKMLENYFSFYIIDAINNKVAYYKDILDISKVNGFTVSVFTIQYLYSTNTVMFEYLDLRNMHVNLTIILIKK